MISSLIETSAPEGLSGNARWQRFAGWGSLLFACLCIGALAFLGTHLPELRIKKHIFLEWMLLAGASLGLSGFVALRYRERWPRISRTINGWYVVAATAALLGSLVVYNGLRQFGGYDHSGLIEITWNLKRGLTPYTDFPCTYPPAFFLGALYAFKIFGVHWSSFVYAGALTAIAAFLAVYMLLRRAELSLGKAIGVALLPNLMTYVLIGYWWWNPLASIAVVLAFSSCFAVLFKPNSRFAWFTVYASAVLLILTKPNAWPAAICYASLLFVSRTAALRVLSAVAAALVTAEGICRVHGFSLAQAVRAYHSIASTRGNPSDFHAFWGYGALPLESRFNLALTGSLLVIALYNLATIKFVPGRSRFILSQIPFYLCIAGAIGSGLGLALTNYEVKLCDLAPVAFAIALLTVFRPSDSQLWQPGNAPYWVKIPVFTAISFCVLGSLYWGQTRLKVRTIGENTFYQPQASTRIRAGFFESVKVGDRLPETVAQMEAALQGRGTEGVFFGPRIEFGYAYFDLAPAKGLPIFWHEGSAYPGWMRPEIERAFWAQHFGTLVFLKDDYTFMPPEMVDAIRRDYLKRDDWPLLDVYYSKKEQ